MYKEYCIIDYCQDYAKTKAGKGTAKIIKTITKYDYNNQPCRIPAPVLRAGTTVAISTSVKGFK